MQGSDPRYIKLELDIAHYQQGGGDPVAAIRKYRDWIDVVHLKDVRPAPEPSGPATPKLASGSASEGGYQFVELGRGKVDLPGVFAALREIKYQKWAIVELDRVPDPGRTPKEAAETNKRYLIETMHQTIQP